MPNQAFEQTMSTVNHILPLHVQRQAELEASLFSHTRQTILHLHINLLPRCKGHMPDPRGGTLDIPGKGCMMK